jgi:hypothetical protein
LGGLGRRQQLFSKLEKSMRHASPSAALAREFVGSFRAAQLSARLSVAHSIPLMRHLCRGATELPSISSRARQLLQIVVLGAVARSACGCSSMDETRVDAVVGPGEGRETQNEGRLEPDDPSDDVSGASPSDGSAMSGDGEPGLVEDREMLPEVAGGMVSDNRDRPRIDDLSDRRVFRGDGVLLSGGQLLPNPLVLIGQRGVRPLEASLTSLKFAVPDDLELLRCEVTFRLFVKTDNGLSVSTELAVLETPPKITLLEDRVWAGQRISLRVEPQDQGVLEIVVSGRAAVRAELSADGTLTIPRDTPGGPALLRWVTPCGEAVAPIEVRPPQN